MNKDNLLNILQASGFDDISKKCIQGIVHTVHRKSTDIFPEHGEDYVDPTMLEQELEELTFESFWTLLQNSRAEKTGSLESVSAQTTEQAEQQEMVISMPDSMKNIDFEEVSIIDMETHENERDENNFSFTLDEND